MDGPATHWLEIRGSGGTTRVALRGEAVSVGGANADVPLDGVGSDQLRVFPEREGGASVFFLGEGPRPTIGGVPRERCELEDGSELHWGDARLVYRFEVEASLEEIEEVRPAERAPGSLPDDELAAWYRVKSGLLVEQRLAEPVAAKRWQDAVREGRFQGDACAREILARAGGASSDPRVLQRATRLQRDLVMAPLQGGARRAGRQARRAAKGGLAFVIAQGTALFVFALIVLAVAALLRLRGISVDGFLDRLLLRG